MIKVVLADDHAVVRHGLRFMLEQRPDIQVVGECGDGARALELVTDLLPDVALLDLLMPTMDGVAVSREIKRLVPSTQIIILTSYYDDEHIFNAIKAGALSYLLKDSSPQELVEAVRAAARGESKLHPMVAARLLREMQRRPHTPLNDLTPRELEVLARIALGRTNFEIAQELVISEPTVRTHVANILSKLHLADRTQAAIYALQQHLVPLKDALDQEEYPGLSTSI
jgi:NarL family two-component system response regulator LiaR